MVRRTGFAQLHRNVVGPYLRVLTGNETKVLIAVLLQANPKTHACELTLGEIAEEAGVERRKVTAHLRDLEARGLLESPGKTSTPGRTSTSSPCWALARLCLCYCAKRGKRSDSAHARKAASKPLR